MSEVIWRQHPRLENYEVSNDGRVRSTGFWIEKSRGSGTYWKPGRIIKFGYNEFGYLVAGLTIKKQMHHVKMHVLVCEAFHGPKPSPEMQVRHLNGDKLDNRPENLCWGTPKENAEDMKRHRSNPRWTKTHCKRGHEFTDVTTLRTKKGRECKVCRALVLRRWYKANPDRKRSSKREG